MSHEQMFFKWMHHVYDNYHVVQSTLDPLTYKDFRSFELM